MVLNAFSPWKMGLGEVSRKEEEQEVARLRSALPELPSQTRARLEADHGLDCLSSARLVEWPQLLELDCVRGVPIAQRVAAAQQNHSISRATSRVHLHLE